MDKKKIVVYINTMNASGGIERVVSNLLENWSKTDEVILHSWKFRIKKFYHFKI